MGRLYLGIGGHWVDDGGSIWRSNYDFDYRTAGRYYFWTQTVLKIRSGERYPGTGEPVAGTGTQLAYFKVWDGDENFDSDSSNWRFVYNSVESSGLSGNSPDAVAQAWIDAVIAAIETSLADDPLDPANGGPGGRIMEIDDETLKTGLAWGRVGQSVNVSHFRCPSIQLAQDHQDLFLPYKIALIEALKTRWPSDSWGWYNMPHSANKQQPYDKTWWLDPEHEPPELADPTVVDDEDLPLLAYSGFVHGHAFMPEQGVAPMQTVERRKGWWRGTLGRKKAIADGLGKPLIASYWFYQNPSSVYATITEEDKITEFFQVCVELGIQDVVFGCGDADWDTWAAANSMDRGEQWRRYVVRPALLTGFLRSSDGRSPLNSRPMQRNTLHW